MLRTQVLGARLTRASAVKPGIREREMEGHGGCNQDVCASWSPVRRLSATPGLTLEEKNPLELLLFPFDSPQVCRFPSHAVQLGIARGEWTRTGLWGILSQFRSF